MKKRHCGDRWLALAGLRCCWGWILRCIQGLKLEPAAEGSADARRAGFRSGRGRRSLCSWDISRKIGLPPRRSRKRCESQSGLKLDIFGMKSKAKAEGGSIVLARLQDARVRNFLAENGLKADSAVGQQGYLLFSDDSHLIVAANTGQGLFYGVQTLRQLLRPKGNGLICPAVGIRDWPSLQNNVPALSQLWAPQFLNGR